MFWLYFFIVYCLISGVLTYKFITSSMSYLNDQDFDFLKKYRFSERSDYNNWSKIEMILCGIFLFIPRLILIVIILIIMIILQYILLLFYCFKIDHSCHNFKIISNKIINYGSRIILFCFGYYWIKRQFIATKKGSNYGDLMNVKVIIANHIAFTDIFALTLLNPIPSLLAKSAIRNIPIIGKLADILNCIYVDRSKKDARSDVINILKNRIKHMKDHNYINPILIFPEGTTNNGTTIFEFKKGAFILEEKIRIIILDYRGTRLNPAFNLVSFGNSIVLQLLQLYGNLKIIELDIIVNTSDFKDWESVAEYCRTIMAKYGDFKLSNGNYALKTEAENYLNTSINK